MRKFLRKIFAKKKLLKGNMTDLELRMWCIENCKLWDGFSYTRAKELYRFLSVPKEELMVTEK